VDKGNYFRHSPLVIPASRRHQQPQISRVASGLNDGNNLAVIHHRDPIRQRHHFVQFETTSTAAPGRASNNRLRINSIEPTSTPRSAAQRSQLDRPR
jgi:hypothetical protein